VRITGSILRVIFGIIQNMKQLIHNATKGVKHVTFSTANTKHITSTPWNENHILLNSRKRNQKTDFDRLEFPKDIAPTIGVRKETINFWKKKGCQFVGRKTTINWVRQFMATVAGGNDYGIS